MKPWLSATPLVHFIDDSTEEHLSTDHRLMGPRSRESTDHLIGAWRIEEHPERIRGQHPWGPPFTHWLILGDYGLVVGPDTGVPESVLDFDFALRVYSGEPKQLWLGGVHGGGGYYERDGDLLFIGMGMNGARPPRFASDCGWFFAFERDPKVTLPEITARTREPAHHPDVGTVVWSQDAYRVGPDVWKGLTPMGTEAQLKVEITEDRLSLQMQLPLVARVLNWLRQPANFAKMKLECGDAVAEWVFEEPERHSIDLAEWDEKKVGETCDVYLLQCDDGRVWLWGGTSFDIDHSLHVHMRIDGDAIEVSGVSIEG